MEIEESTVDGRGSETTAEAVGGKPHPVTAGFGLALVIWTLVFDSLLRHKHEFFKTNDYDLGIFDHYTWLLSNGETESTIRGLDFFAHHANFGLILLAPFYWLGAGPNFLNLLQVLSIAVGAFGLYRIGEHYGLAPTHAAIAASLLPMNFSISWIMLETFHPELLAIAPLVFAYLFALERRWGRYALMVVAAIIWKEDIALAVSGLGLVLALRRPFADWRKPGLLTFAFGVAWFFLTVSVLIPRSGSSEVFYSSNFALGDTPLQVAGAVVAEPSALVTQLDDANAVGYVRDVGASFGFVSFLSPVTLLIGFPQFLVNMLSIHGYTHSPRFHYTAVPVLSMSLAFVEVVRRASNLSVRRFFLGLGFAAALATAAAWGVSPIGRYYAETWPTEGEPRLASFEESISFPDHDDHVVTSFNISTHLSHRQSIYTFPNPWIPRNWGRNDRLPDDTIDIDWLIIDTWTLDEGSLALLDTLRSSGLFEVRFEGDGIVVAERAEDTPNRRLIVLPDMSGWQRVDRQNWVLERPHLNVTADDEVLAALGCAGGEAVLVDVLPVAGYLVLEDGETAPLNATWGCAAARS